MFLEKYNLIFNLLNKDFKYLIDYSNFLNII